MEIYEIRKQFPFFGFAFLLLPILTLSGCQGDAPTRPNVQSSAEVGNQESETVDEPIEFLIHAHHGQSAWNAAQIEFVTSSPYNFGTVDAEVSENRLSRLDVVLGPENLRFETSESLRSKVKKPKLHSIAMREGIVSPDQTFFSLRVEIVFGDPPEDGRGCLLDGRIVDNDELAVFYFESDGTIDLDLEHVCDYGQPLD